MASGTEDLQGLFPGHMGRPPACAPSSSHSTVRPPACAPSSSQSTVRPLAYAPSSSQSTVRLLTCAPSSSQSTVYKKPPGDQSAQEADDIDDEDDDDVFDGEEPTVEERVQTFLDSDDEEVEEDTVNESDMVKVQNLICNGCGCQLNCSEQFSEEILYDNISDIREMDRSQREMHIMEFVVDSQDHDMTKKGKKRKRLSYEYSFCGKRVCKTTFMVAFSIGKKALANLMQHVNEHGLVPRTHGNIGKRPNHSLKHDEVKHVVQYISNFADEFGLPQPAAPRGSDNTSPIYLPKDKTKKFIHDKYIACCLSSNIRAVKYSTFGKIWNACLPHVKVSTLRDDVCATCEKLRKEMMDSVTEESKLQTTERMRQHIFLAQKEREIYNRCIQQARETYQNNTVQNYVHYTFGFCQNVCLPHHSEQTGPVYFTTPRKVQIFGFRIDGIPKQLNFLMDENETIGKDGTQTSGPNAIISMIDWALNKYRSPERKCTFHADNCPGQNKNRFVLGYLMWRVMTGKHDHIEYMMQVPGHAHCLVDSGFASLKQKYSHLDCDTLDQLEDIVSLSSVTNEVVRYPAWKWRDWKAFLSPVFKKLRGVRQYQYFRFSSAQPGMLIVRKGIDDKESGIDMLRHQGCRFGDNVPAEIPPGGLSKERQDYLYKMVRPHVSPSCQDITCPQPKSSSKPP